MPPRAHLIVRLTVDNIVRDGDGQVLIWLGGPPTPVTEPFAALRQLVFAGGKRLRPLLVFLSAPRTSEPAPVAAAVKCEQPASEAEKAHEPGSGGRCGNAYSGASHRGRVSTSPAAR